MNITSAPTMAITTEPAFWQRFANAAQISSALVSIAALGAIYWQVQFNFKLSRDNTAHESYRAYLQMAVQYPRPAHPRNAARHFDDDAGRQGAVRLVGLLPALHRRGILGSFPGDPEWQRTCEAQVGYHAPYICATVLKDEIGNYDQQLQALIRKVASSAAECKKA